MMYFSEKTGRLYGTIEEYERAEGIVSKGNDAEKERRFKEFEEQQDFASKQIEKTNKMFKELSEDYPDDPRVMRVNKAIKNDPFLNMLSELEEALRKGPSCK